MDKSSGDDGIMTRKEAYKLCCMWYRAYRRNRVDAVSFIRARDLFFKHGFKPQWEAAYILYLDLHSVT